MVDQNSEMAPPWEAFPTYERYSIGWRMGAGEVYSNDWYTFIENLSDDYETRLGYLERHRPAPLNWADEVLWVLSPGAGSNQEEDDNATKVPTLLKLGLVAHDAAYHTWLSKQTEIGWPWSWSSGITPQEASRYKTREFWFFSRQLNTLKTSGDMDIGAVPDSWINVETQLSTGKLGDIDTTQGLLALARMFCAGDVKPPWAFGLSPDDFTDSFEMDMGFTDAFRLWTMSSFDDNLSLWKLLDRTAPPSEWVNWVEGQVDFE